MTSDETAEMLTAVLNAAAASIRAETLAARGVPVARCVFGEVIYHLEDTEARFPGHIYSQLGRDIYNDIGCCEFHIDTTSGNEFEDDDQIWDDEPPTILGRPVEDVPIRNGIL